MDEIDDLLNDFYGKYNKEVLTDEKRNTIKSAYGSDYTTLLKDLYGKYANENLSEDKMATIVEAYNLKKKEVTSTDLELDSAPNEETTNSDLPKSEEEPTPISYEAKTADSAIAELDELPSNNEPPSDIVSSFKNTESLTDEEQIELKQEVEYDGDNKGVWNSVKQGVKSWWNNVFDEEGLQVDTDNLGNSKKQAHDFFNKEGIQPSESEFIQKAKEFEYATRKKSLIATKKRDFLKNLSDRERTVLWADSGLKEKMYSEKDVLLITEQKILRKDAEAQSVSLKTLEAEILSFKKNNEEIPKELIASYKAAYEKTTQSLSKAKAQYLEYAENNEKLGKAQNNVDLFKRDYSWFKNFIGNIASPTGDLLSGMVGVASYLRDLHQIAKTGVKTKDPISLYLQKTAGNLSGEAEEIREAIMKPISVDDINGLSDFGSWLSNTAIAQQIPIISLIATGTGGIVSLGASSTGQKYTEMENEGGYSFAQSTFVPLAFGTAETIGGIVDATVLRGTMRVFKSATDVERKIISKGMFAKALEYSKGFLKESGKAALKEVPEEVGVQFFQNGLDIFALDKKDVNLGDGIKDAAAASLPFSLLPGGGYIANKVFKPFTLDSKLEKTLGDIALLEGQLNNPETVLSEKGKDALTKKLIDKKNTLAAISISISKDIKNLDNTTYNEILNIEKSKKELREDALEIQNDASINKDAKKLLLKDYQEDFNQLNANQKLLLTKANSKNFTSLAKDEQTKLKEVAAKALVQEKQDQGETEYKIDDAAITKKAIELANTSLNTLDKKRPSERSDVDLTTSNLTSETLQDAPPIDTNLQTNNETQTQGDLAPNEDVSTGVGIDENKGQEDNIQTSTDTRSSDEKVEVKETVKKVVLKNNSKYDVTLDSKGTPTKVVNSKTGKEISKFREVTYKKKDKKTGKIRNEKKVQLNPNYSTIVSQATGEKTALQIAQDEKTTLNKALDSYTPSNAYEHVLDFFARNNKIDPTSAKKETGLTDKELKWATFSNKKGKLPSVVAVAENIVANSQQELDIQEVRNALIDVLSSNSNIKDLQQKIIEQVNEQEKLEQNESEYQFLNSLSEKERALFLDTKAENDYISELTFQEKTEYYETNIERRISENVGERQGEIKSVEERVGTKSESGSESESGSRSGSRSGSGSGTNLPNGSAQEKHGSSDSLLGKYRSFKSGLGERSRKAEKERNTQLTTQEKEDLEKFYALEFAKENDLWIKDFYSLGTKALVGGNEHTLVLNEKTSFVYKSNNLINSKNLISNLLASVAIGNKLFSGTKYEFVGFTGIDNGDNRVPLIEVVYKQKFFPKTSPLEQSEIDSFMSDLGFKNTTPGTYVDPNYLVFDLYPRNVLKDSDGNIFVIDGEFEKITQEKGGLETASSKITDLKPEDTITTETLEDVIKSLEQAKKNLKDYGKENLSFGLPVALAQGTIDAMLLAAKTAKLGIDIINAGINHIKKSDWYKSLNKEEKIDFDKEFQNKNNFFSSISKVVDEVKKAEKQKSDKRANTLKVPPSELGNSAPKNSSNKKQQAFSTRSFQSENLNDTTRKKLDKLGLEYDVESQLEARQNAEKIIAELGILDAYKLAKEGQIRGGARTWIKAVMFEELNQQIFDAEGNAELIETLSEEQAQIMKEFADEQTLNGQELSMLNSIYKKFDIKYDLNFTKQRWAKKFKSEIPPQVLAKFKKAEQEIQKLTEKITALEKKLGTQQEQEAFKNIQEVFQRHQKKSTRDYRMSETELKRKKELRNKFFGTLNDISRIVTLLADPEFREYIGLVFKSAKGDFKNFSNKIKNEIGIRKKEAVSKLFNEAKKEFDTFLREKLLSSESEVEQGALKIPNDLLYELVEGGIDTIENLTEAVRAFLKEQYPNLTHREVRDAITKYGKQINPTQDVIRQEISRLKTDGKQYSALEDLALGKRPKRSGRKPLAKTAAQRNRLKQIQALLKDLLIDDTVDKERFYKTALEGYKTRLQNRLADLNKAMESGERIINEKKNLPLDPEAISLREQRDAAQKEYDAFFGKPYKSDETLITEIIRRKEKTLRDLEVKLEETKLTKKEQVKPQKRTVKDPRIDALEMQIAAEREALNTVYEEVGIAEAKRLDRAKKYVAKRIADLYEKIRIGDYSRRKPKSYVYDKDLIELKRKLIEAKVKFDIEFEKQEFKELGIVSKIGEYFYLAFGTFKGIKATADFSAMLRQGILLGSRNPKEYVKATKDMHKFAFNSENYQNFMTAVESSDDFVYMVEDGLSITDTSGDVLRSEERFVGNLLSSKIMVKGFNLNVVGRVTDASERAYGGFLNSLRISVYRKLVAKHEAMGYSRQKHPKLFKNIAKMVNNTTGRGAMSSDKRVAKVLNLMFFSPRMITGMAGVIKDMGRKDSTPYLRGQAATSLATFIGYQFVMKLLISEAYQLLVMPFSGEDEDDITKDMNVVSTDFNKLKIGDTRYDVSSGWGIAVRTLARFALKKSSSGIDSEDKKFDGYLKSGGGELLNFFSNKMSPLARQLYNVYEGKHPTEFGKDFSEAEVSDYLQALFVPLTIQELMEGINNDTPKSKLFFDTLLTIYGVGVQTYGGKDKKEEKEFSVSSYK